jgi:hypothetical protein
VADGDELDWEARKVVFRLETEQALAEQLGLWTDKLQRDREETLSKVESVSDSEGIELVKELVTRIEAALIAGGAEWAIAHDPDEFPIE